MANFDPRPSGGHDHSVGRGRSAGWALGALSALALSACAALSLATPGVASAARAPGADAGAMLAGLALVAAWIVVARVVLVAVAVAVAPVPGAIGRLGAQVATACTPGLLRGVVRTALGVSVVAGPLLTGANAFADQPQHQSAGPATAALSPASLDATLPFLDRLVAPSAAPATPGHSARATHAQPAPPRPGGMVVVKPGDTLWEIAARRLPTDASATDIARSWRRWYAANRAVVGADPGLLRPGERLEPPR